MAVFLGVDTGGTYTDAVIVDGAADRVIGSAKSLTTRGDLALGIGRAVDAALAGAGVRADQVRWCRCPPRWPPMRWSKGRAGAWR
jgi:N-methylhydantoinase A/oxoprolinase/acetone carboxylase beta subunit